MSPSVLSRFQACYVEQLNVKFCAPSCCWFMKEGTVFSAPDKLRLIHYCLVQKKSQGIIVEMYNCLRRNWLSISKVNKCRNVSLDGMRCVCGSVLFRWQRVHFPTQRAILVQHAVHIETYHDQAMPLVSWQQLMQFRLLQEHAHGLDLILSMHRGPRMDIHCYPFMQAHNIQNLRSASIMAVTRSD